MRSSSVLSVSLVSLVVLTACTSSFSISRSTDVDGAEAGDEAPSIMGIPSGDGSAPAEAGSPDASATHADAGTTPPTDHGPTADAGAAADVLDTADAMASEDTGSPACPAGDLECGGSCVPSGVHDCGSCGHDCTNLVHVSGATSCASGGACSFPASACAAGWADCNANPDDGCETDVTTPAHCGSCTNECSSTDPVCAGSVCGTGCPSATATLCSGTCVDTSSNASDCGGCGHACADTVPNSQPTCTSSACAFTCNSGFSGCPAADPTSCVDEQDDAMNCGACGKTCPAPASGAGQAACAGAVCTLNCSAGLTACPAVSPTECANTTDDLNNCGGCGDACTTTVANAHATCGASRCGFACDTGYLACGSNACIPAADTVDGAFVSPSGSGSACTAAQPCTTIAAAIATGKAILYLDQGTYTENVLLPAANLTIHGGWTQSAGTWTDCNATNATSILAAPAGAGAPLSSDSVGTWAVDTLTIRSVPKPADTTSHGYGVTVLGVDAREGTLSLTDVIVNVAAAGGGGPGFPGTAGASPSASCTAGDGSTGPSGPAGAPVGQGAYGAGAFSAGAAGSGASGANGDNGTAGGVAPTASSCGLAADGDGCGSHTVQGGPGNPGCGGGGGTGGGGGYSGGASIGILASLGATVTLSGVSIQTGAGGQGGAGAPGGAGATGSPGTTGGAGAVRTGCTVTPAGCKAGQGICSCSLGSAGSSPGGIAGGPGGAGGSGGPGAGGTGGDSVCYATVDTARVLGTPTCTTGPAGVGGLDGNGSTGFQGTTGRSAVHN
jgi:hypothetical protein